jgi:hypothetical protein
LAPETLVLEAVSQYMLEIIRRRHPVLADLSRWLLEKAPQQAVECLQFKLQLGVATIQRECQALYSCKQAMVQLAQAVHNSSALVPVSGVPVEA